jgi:microcystin-dependent protein
MTPAQYFGLLAALGSAPGIMLPFAGTVSPGGFLLCDGSAVSRATYGALFTAIGTAFGVGDGSTTFNLPDMRSRFAVGVGTGSGLSTYAIGDTGGAEGQALAQANLPSVSLDVAVDSGAPLAGGVASIQGSTATSNPGTVNGTVPTGGIATPVPILPPFLAINWLIKT